MSETEERKVHTVRHKHNKTQFVLQFWVYLLDMTLWGVILSDGICDIEWAGGIKCHVPGISDRLLES